MRGFTEVTSCFTSTETVWTIRDGELRTSTSTYTQLLSSNEEGLVVLYVHRDRTEHQGRGAQDVHLDFHTASELCGGPGLPVPNKPYGFCGRDGEVMLNVLRCQLTY